MVASRVGKLLAVGRCSAWTSHNQALRIIAANDERSDRVLGTVVVDGISTVFHIANQPWPLMVQLEYRRGNVYRWKSKYGGMGVSEVSLLKELERDNKQLKKIVADKTLTSACSRT